MDVTILSRLIRHAEDSPDKTIYISLDKGESRGLSCTYSQLRDRVISIAGTLTESGYAGRQAIVLDAHPLNFIQTFLGCLAAGVVAVPVPMATLKHADAMLAIARDAEAACILAGTRELEQLAESASPELGRLAWHDVGSIPTRHSSLLGRDVERVAFADPQRLAFLQYTSGSTGAPKGVMVSHGNLMANERAIGRAMRMHRDSVVIGWLPHYHDMGLIGNLLQTLYQGAQCVLMQPIDFIQKPARWLRAISDYKGTVSGGPNFAYDLCVLKVGEEQRQGLDLTSWEVAYTGAEPVRSRTVAAFAKAYAPYGLRAGSVFPCYGMAESTLYITGVEQGEGARRFDLDRRALSTGDSTLGLAADDAEAVPFIGCGAPGEGIDVLIVHPETRLALPDGSIGEIWVRGDSVAQGYFRNPALTEAVFKARLADAPQGPDYLRTGDLGSLRYGQLLVVGRLKDVLIVRGKNHYPQDFESTAQAAHPALAYGGGAAFQRQSPHEDQVVIVHELTRQGLRHPQRAEIADAVRAELIRLHGVAVSKVLLIKPGHLPRTTSGKVRRSRCRDVFERDGFESIDAVELGEAS